MSTGDITDLPLILILSEYTYFLFLDFVKIQSFCCKIWLDTDFFKNAKEISLYFLWSQRFFFPKVLIFLVIYTDSVLDQSAMSGYSRVLSLNYTLLAMPKSVGTNMHFFFPQALKDRVVPHVRALVILPVRDLAIQVFKVFRQYSEGTSLKVSCTFMQILLYVEYLNHIWK